MPRTPRHVVLALTAAAFVLALAPAASAQPPIKVAVIDTEAVLAKSNAGKQALADLQALKEKKEGEGKKLEDDLKELSRRANEGRLSLSEDKLAEIQQQIEDKQIALKRFQDDANRELNKKKDEVLAAIDRKVMPVIAQVSKEKGYALIFRKFESGLVWASEEVDITDEVISRIDATTSAPAAGGGTGSGG